MSKLATLKGHRRYAMIAVFLSLVIPSYCAPRLHQLQLAHSTPKQDKLCTFEQSLALLVSMHGKQVITHL